MKRSLFLKSAAALFATPMIFKLPDRHKFKSPKFQNITVDITINPLFRPMDMIRLQDQIEADLLQLFSEERIPYTDDGIKMIEKRVSTYQEKLQHMFGKDLIFHTPMNEFEITTHPGGKPIKIT